MPFPIQIDATTLVYRKFIIPNSTVSSWTDSTVIQTVQLEPGVYSFQVSSGLYCSFTFSVTPTGTIDYQVEYSNFLSGKGTNRLTLNGFEVKLDARYLPGAGIIFSGDMPDLNNDWFTLKTCRMLPQSAYSVQQGSGSVSTIRFGIDPNGHFTYDLASDVTHGGSLQGARTSTLSLLGFPLLIDARETAGNVLILEPLLEGIVPSTTKVEAFNLLPGEFSLQFVSGVISKAKFTLDLAGQVHLESDGFLGSLRLDTFHGLTRLTVNDVHEVIG